MRTGDRFRDRDGDLWTFQADDGFLHLLDGDGCHTSVLVPWGTPEAVESKFGPLSPVEQPSVRRDMGTGEL